MKVGGLGAEIKGPLAGMLPVALQGTRMVEGESGGRLRPWWSAYSPSSWLPSSTQFEASSECLGTQATYLQPCGRMDGVILTERAMPGTPTWLIETRGTDPAQVPQRLLYAVEELGMEAILAPYVPFRQEFDPSFLPADRPVIFYGSVSTVRCFARLPSPAVRPFA